MIETKISDFLNAPLDSINLGDIKTLKLNSDVKLYWGDEPIGILIKGINIFSPNVEAIQSDLLTAENRLLISAKLQKWVDTKVTQELKSIKENIDNSVSSNVRAIVYNTFNQLGSLIIGQHSSFIKKINEEDKAIISKLGIRIGAKFFFYPKFFKKISNGIMCCFVESIQ